MILVKSLIVILFLIIVFAIYNNWGYFAKKFDGREGFGQAEQAEQAEQPDLWQAEKDEADRQEVIEEISYTLPTAIDQHELHAGDAKFINELQEKMTELFQLSEKASAINKNLKD